MLFNRNSKRINVVVLLASIEYQDRFGSLHSHSNSECGR